MKGSASSYLEAVVIPTRQAEIDVIERNIDLWALPEFAPANDQTSQKPRLIFSFSDKKSQVEEDRILRRLTSKEMDRYFRSFEFIYLGLSGLDNIYSRSNTGPVGQAGYKAGPNNQFFRTLRALRSEPGALFYMETDCVPIRANWINAIDKVLAGHESAYVIGSVYRGRASLPLRILRHINGNAIYRADVEGFYPFLDVWEERLFDLIQKGHTNLAYDNLIETDIYLSARNHVSESPFWEIIHRLQYSDIIYNVSAKSDIYRIDKSYVSNIIEEKPETFFIHGALFARAVKDLFSSNRERVPKNLLITNEACDDNDGSKLGGIKRRISQSLRDCADWLETRDVKRDILRRLTTWQ